jgi:hypothetical protein
MEMVAEVARKMAGGIDILSWLRHTWWGADPLLLLRLYKSLLRARIEYGSFLIHSLSNSQKVLIEKIQFKALTMALGQRSSTPANFLWGGGGQNSPSRDFIPIFSSQLCHKNAHA